MKRLIILFVIALTAISSFGQIINNTTERKTVRSEVLNDNRNITVYLPASYNATNQDFPVIYILDGDYNFFYVAGLLELQSSISENIPEMILVAISGKGTQTYRHNIKPNIEGINDSGNADDYAEFILTELIPFVNKNYRTAEYKILAGHSAGGLFVINTLLHQPNAFNNYIAISPSLWWEKNAINGIAKEIFKTNPNFSSDVYVSLADEQGMGIDKFLDVVKENNISAGVFKFKHFPEENHNSVGHPTYTWALKEIFKTWKGDKQYFTKPSELSEYLETVKKTYGSTFNMQPTLLAYTIYMMRKSDDDLAKTRAEFLRLNPTALAQFDNALAVRYMAMKKKLEAMAVLDASINSFPEYFENYHTMAKLKLAQKDNETALKLINKGIELAKKQRARQWMVNQMLETKSMIEK